MAQKQDITKQDGDEIPPSMIRDLEQRMIYKDIEISNLKRHVKELEHICMTASEQVKEKHAL